MKFQDFTHMQKSDRKALLFLLSIAAIATLAIFFLGNNVKDTTAFDKDSTRLEQGNDIYYGKGGGSYQGYQRHRRRQGSYIYNNVRTARPQRFAFDPNTADSTQLLSLGLAPWQVRSIYHYRAKGGVFRTPDDFAKVYELTQKQFNELKPFINISKDYQQAAIYTVGRNQYNPYNSQDRDTLLHPIKLKPTEKIVLNTADTTTLKKVPGIGSGWARTIANYGSYLGGYVNVGQLLELDGFPEELLSYFVIKNPTTKKLKINELTLNQLKRHPYINFYQAHAIIDYRRLNGKLESLNQLKLLKEFPEDVIKRLEPYIEY